jgi:hypothetical protein
MLPAAVPPPRPGSTWWPACRAMPSIGHGGVRRRRRSLFLPDAEAAGQWLAQTLAPGDVVLVKGSRGVHLERAIEAVKVRA